jgi:hypothetical protein
MSVAVIVMMRLGGVQVWALGENGSSSSPSSSPSGLKELPGLETEAEWAVTAAL